MVLQQSTRNPSMDGGWILEENHFDPEYLSKYEAIFTQGNGYLGQRAALDEHYWGETRNLFVSGTFDRFHDSEVSELPNLPDVTNISLYVDGERFSLLGGKIEQYSRRLNLHSGELVREVRWISSKGTALDIVWRRVVSMADKHMLASQMSIRADKAVELTITSGIDGTVTNTGTQHTVEGYGRVYDDAILEYPCKTLNSGIQVITHAVHHLSVDGISEGYTMKIVSSRRYLGASYSLSLKPGQDLVLEKQSAVNTARDLVYQDLDPAQANEHVLRDSLASFRQKLDQNYESVLRKSSLEWKKYWDEHDVRVMSSNPRDQLVIRFAIYHLNIMTNHKDSRMGIGAKGLSGEGYKGHSFWDTETFIFPFFLFTQPLIGRNLLEYRYKCLSGAKDLAKKRGYQGAMYPWESGWIGDGDVTPDNLGVDLVTGKILQCKTGDMEHHVTADIAFAVYQYFKATGDIAFMEQCGYEMLLETARFWASRVEWKEEKQRYEITHVIGPDEYQEDVNNNAYTNYLAAKNMTLGLWVLDQLTRNPDLKQKLDKKIQLQGLRELLIDRTENIYLPLPDSKTGVLPQYEGYFELEDLDITSYCNAPKVAEIMKDFNFEMLRKYQVAKQADVVQLMFLCEELFPGELRRKNYQYYEPRTLHDSSLSKAIHSVIASDLGMCEEAYRMFHGAANTDLREEPHSSDTGIHSANMGGMWQAVVMGFGGLRAVDDRLRIVPHLPACWDKLAYKVCWKERTLSVEVTKDTVSIHNNGAELEIQSIHGPLVLPPCKKISYHYV